MGRRKKSKKLKSIFTKKNEKFIKCSKAFIGSKRKVLRILSLPLAVIFLSEYKNEIFSRPKEAFSNQRKNENFYSKNKYQFYFDFQLKYTVFLIVCGLSVSESKFLKVLYRANPKKRLYYVITLMENGSMNLARLTVINLIDHHLNYFNEKQKYDIFSLAAVSSFLLGFNDQACEFWSKCGELKNTWLLPSSPLKYRILGNDWFAAIGHAAMLDFYFKYQKLYGSGDYRVVTKLCLSQQELVKTLSRKFYQLGLSALNEKHLEADYNKWATSNSCLSWDELNSLEKESLVDDFWHYEFPDGEILGYAHAASRIQKDWERSNNPPLLRVTDEEHKWLNKYKNVLGMPKDAWYVCLHVREAGYHQTWNKLYPTIRDAKIESYYEAIKEITDAGGWVIRMGDPSMKPIKDMPNVIDYAQSPLRQPQADLLFPATCKFFLGTNSGFATIPVIFGTPCALTNWVPIGWPLWASQDLMIFKLFREKKSKRYLTLEELFETKFAFMQNTSDLPPDIEIVNNSPEEIRQLTSQMLQACVFNSTSLKDIGASESIMNNYDALAKKYKTFSGSRFCKHFVNKHPQVFGCLNENKKFKINDKVSLKNTFITKSSELTSCGLEEKV